MNAKQQAILRELFYDSLMEQFSNGTRVKEGLLIRLDEADVILRAIIKKNRVDLQAEAEAKAEAEARKKQAEERKAERIAKAEAKKVEAK